ncbi:hypothetical protein GCK72_000012 [Caenorhabditis remanei]|uniref:C2H2-type domain-containing protein n=1 Tax=Caenorhabditis remanei TaxID=31234 RepID=A0A6A5HJ52_CAERE|nr:hypothetical protein GCK72_000012 [Caenorhabditis remanei]KAF1768200.1 hypothetical protein GCK72_000012 [Caenorhabditis remanei]
MSSEQCLFKYKDGYILLEDLESWYGQGFITPEDRIQIFEGSTSVNYKISALVELYGKRSPFRRIPKRMEHDPLAEYSSSEDEQDDQDYPNDYDCTHIEGSSTPPPAPQDPSPQKKMGGAFGAKRIACQEQSPINKENPVDLIVEADRPSMSVQTRIMENSKFIFRDYALYNVDIENEGDKITGHEVITEMRRLKSMIDLSKWTISKICFFKFLHRKNNRNNRKPSVPICRLCNYTPFSGLLFLSHMFREDHIQMLSQHMVPKESFQYWESLFEKCQKQCVLDEPFDFNEEKKEEEILDQEKIGPCKTVSLYTTIPLFSSNTSTDLPKLDSSTISILLYLTSQWQWREENNFLAKLYKSVNIPQYCKVCEEDLEWHETRFTRHIMSENHLSGLTGISQKELNFWVNILTLEVVLKGFNNRHKTRILEYRNQRPIPLFDFKVETTILEENLRSTKMVELRTLFDSINKKLLVDPEPGIRSWPIHQGVACFACDLPKSFFKTELDLVLHLFTEKHLNYLLKFGFSEKAFLWWKKFFDNILSSPGGRDPIYSFVRRTSSLQMSDSPLQDFVAVPTVLPLAVPPAVPSPLQTAEQSITQEQNVFDSLPRIPLLSFPPKEALKANQQTFIMSMREIVSALTMYGKEVADRNFVNWKCAYCSSEEQRVILSSELEAFNHIASQKHLEKMKFTASIDDLQHWKEWAIATNPVIKIEAQAPDSEEASGPLPNVPRVPMLDKVPPGAECVTEKRQFYGYLMKYKGKFQYCDAKVLEKGRAMQVNWKCTFCTIRHSTLHIQFSDMMSAFLHIVTSKHWRKMGCKASIKDLNYWVNWAVSVLKRNETISTVSLNKSLNESFNTTGKEESNVACPGKNSPRVAMIDEMPENEDVVSSNLTDNAIVECVTENRMFYGCLPSIEDQNYWKNWKESVLKRNETTTTASLNNPLNKTEKEESNVACPGKNSPRVAMIDKMPENEDAVSKETFNRILDEARKKFKKGGKQKNRAVSRNKKNYATHWVCSFCCTPSKTVTLGNEMDAFLHIAKGVHRENMQYTACLSDLLYWKTWVDELHVKLEKETPLPIKLDPPRVPLLDKPLDTDSKLSESDFLTRYNAIRLRIPHLKSCIVTEQKVNYTCKHCPGTNEITTIHELIEHVFDGRHHSYIQFSATLSDFTFYENLIEIANPNVSEAQGKECLIAQKPVAPPSTVPSIGTVKTTPISVVNPVRTTTVIPDCELPLFCPLPSTRKPSDSTCPGPTNRQIEFVSKTKLREFIPHIPFFTEPTRCGLCDVNMSQWALLHVTSHVFSVGHLNKFKSNGVIFYQEDFEWWITKLNSATVLRVPSSPSQLTNYYLGGLKQISTLATAQDFSCLTSAEIELFANIDKTKLTVPKTTASIMIKFGCCVYCNIWFLKPTDAIHHFISDYHFANVKKHHSVKRTEVDEILEIVKTCQKDSLK